jgi:hypothetical protein
MATGVFIALLLNFFILALDIAVAILIGRDARNKGLNWSQTIMWSLISLLFFPIGTGLYFWLGRPRLQKAKEV